MLPRLRQLVSKVPPELALPGQPERLALDVTQERRGRAGAAKVAQPSGPAVEAQEHERQRCYQHTFSRRHLDFQCQSPFSLVQEDEAGVAS